MSGSSPSSLRQNLGLVLWILGILITAVGGVLFFWEGVFLGLMLIGYGGSLMTETSGSRTMKVALGVIAAICLGGAALVLILPFLH